MHNRKPIAGAGASFRFTSTSSEGGILVLPTGAQSIDITCLKRVKTYLQKYASSWYLFLKNSEKWGLELKNHSLFLITGSDMTDSWALAAYSNNGRQTELSFNLNIGTEAAGTASTTYSWEDTNYPFHRVSKGQKGVKNQCVFARMLRISISDPLFGRLKQVIKVKDDAYGGKTPSGRNTSSKAGLANKLFTLLHPSKSSPASNNEEANLSIEDVIITEAFEDCPKVSNHYYQLHVKLVNPP